MNPLQTIGIVVLVSTSLSHGQDAVRDLVAPDVTAPSGFDSIPGTAPGTFADGFTEYLDGWDFGVSTGLYYSSDVTRGGRALPGTSASDTILFVGTSATYRSAGRRWWFGGGLDLGYQQYFENSQFSGFTYGANVQGGFDGGKVDASGSLNYSFDRGGNRNFNGFSENARLSANLQLGYTLSPKTKIDGRFSTDLISPQQTGNGNTNTMRLDISGLWKATPLTTIGLGIAWSEQGGDRQGDRTTLGPVLRINYKLSSKIALNSSFGLDFVEYSAGGDEIGYDIRIGANYRASALWGMNLTFFAGTEPQGNFAGGFRDIANLRLGYNRRLGRNQLNLGVSWETSTLSNPAGVAVGNGDRDYLSFDASLSRAIPLIRGGGTVFFNWQDQSGNAANSYDAFTLGVSLFSSF